MSCFLFSILLTLHTINGYFTLRSNILKLGRTDRVGTEAVVKAFFDDSVDLSTEGNGGILKRVLRKGDNRKGYPLVKDRVEIAWKIYLTNGTLVHDSKAALQEPDDEVFSFTVGAEPREVILGWEHGIRTMLEGEIASYTIQKDYAFGDKGAPELVPPGATIMCDIELLSIIPALSRRFKSVGLNESIKEDLMDDIYSGKSVISEEAMKNRQINETKDEGEIKYYDPEMHAVDPKQRVSGDGRGHFWEETAGIMEVSLPLDRLVSKYDVDVEITASRVSVKILDSQTGEGDTTLLEGPLHGKVLPSLSMWAILEPDSALLHKGPVLRLSLEKGHGHRDIWATVLNREYLANKQRERTEAGEEEESFNTLQ